MRVSEGHRQSRCRFRNPKSGRQLQNFPRFFISQGPFPLTPALSLRERENQGPRCNNSKRLAFSNPLPTMLPLPEGEGRGEGEQNVQVPERRDFGNRLSAFGFLSDFGPRVSDFIITART